MVRCPGAGTPHVDAAQLTLEPQRSRLTPLARSALTPWAQHWSLDLDWKAATGPPPTLPDATVASFWKKVQESSERWVPRGMGTVPGTTCPSARPGPSACPPGPLRAPLGPPRAPRPLHAPPGPSARAPWPLHAPLAPPHVPLGPSTCLPLPLRTPGPLRAPLGPSRAPTSAPGSKGAAGPGGQ